MNNLTDKIVQYKNGDEVNIKQTISNLEDIITETLAILYDSVYSVKDLDILYNQIGNLNDIVDDIVSEMQSNISDKLN